MTEKSDQGEPGEGPGKSGYFPETTQNERTQNKKAPSEKSKNEETPTEKHPKHTKNTSQNQRHHRPNFDRAPTADSVLGSMSGDPKTTRQLDKVMSQLDPDGQAQLSDLVSRFASGGRKKGRMDEAEAYREQNPWHDTPREKPVFSLAEPLPRRFGSDQEGTLPESRAKDKPVFSLGEPLPHQVRKVQRVGTAGKQHAEDDVEQGLRKRPLKDQRDESSPDSDESAGTGETLRGDNTRRQSMSSWKTQKTHRGSQEQGTDAAQQFRVSKMRRLICFFPDRLPDLGAWF